MDSSLDRTLRTGRRMHVRQQGSGPTVVLLHGFPLDHRMWDAQLTALSDQFRVVVPDLRGFGASSLLPVGNDGHGERPLDPQETLRATQTTGEKLSTSMADFADDLAELVVQLELTQPIALAGLSMGGYIAWEFVVRHRSLLGQLILCHTRAEADSPEVARGRLMAAEQLEAEGLTKLSEEMPLKMLGPETAPNYASTLDQCRDWIRAQSPLAAAAAQRGMASRPDRTELLGQLGWPTLVVAGSNDRITPAAGMKQMADQIPGSSWHLVEQAGHLSPVEAPTEVSQVMRQFLLSR